MKSVLIYSFLKHIQRYVLFLLIWIITLLSFCSGATIQKTMLSRCKKDKKKNTFYRESLSRMSVTEFVFQYMNHNPLKQGSHYVNRVLRADIAGPRLWINSAGPGLQRHGATRHRHERSAPGLLLCSAEDTDVKKTFRFYGWTDCVLFLDGFFT